MLTDGTGATRVALSRRRRRALWGLAGAGTGCIALAGAGLAAFGTGSPPVVHLVDATDRPAVGIALPELLQPTRTLSLADFRGKPLVVNFWASWCYPCQTEVPVLGSVARAEHGAVQFVGVDTNDTRQAAKAFLARHPVSYPLLFMPNPVPRIVNAYQLQDVPATVFISADGTMRGSYFGRLTPATLRAAIRSAFG